MSSTPAKETPSYVNHTVKEIAGEIDFKQIFDNIKEGAEALKTIALAHKLDEDGLSRVDPKLF